MALKKLLGVLVLLSAVAAAFGQAAPQGQLGGVPITLGAGYSYFNSDWHRAPGYGGTNNIMGYTIWGDWTFYNAPGAIQGIAVEVEGRDLNFGRSSGADPLLRQVTGSGGVLYKWRHFRVFQPYGKLLFGYGGMDMTTTQPGYTHDTRTVTTLGAGADFVFHDNLIVRADFENQNWPNWNQYHSLTPRGITISLAYDFKKHAPR